MTLKEKFNSIDQSRITADQKAFLDKMKNVTKDFTLENKEVNDKVEGALDKMITSFKEKMPDAIKTSTKVVVPKTAKSKKTTKVVSKTTTPKRTVMSVAKEIRKEGESWKDAQKRASDIIKEDKADVSEVVKKELDRINKFINSRAELKGISGTNIKRDAVRTAKPRGRRISKDGNVYYENRENRTDRLAPNYPKDAPLLADGGYLTDPTFGTFQNQVFADGGFMDGVYAEKGMEVENLDLLIKKGYRFNGGDAFETYEECENIVNNVKSDDVDYIIVKVNSKYPYYTIGEKRKYELGGVMATDLAGHTGGSLGTGDPSMLDGFSNTAYTGLVGETGAMSSGEMFMNGGGLPSGSEQSYMITESLGNPAQHFAFGGGFREKNNRKYDIGRNWTKDHYEFDKNSEHEVEYRRRKKLELGGTVVTDLAGHTGGSLGTGDPSMLSGFSNTSYTGLVGETGAMSSGEMFMNGGGVEEWKKGVTIKIDTRQEAEKNKKLLKEYWGKSGRNFEVEKRGNGYVITYEFYLSDKMELGGGLPSGSEQSYMITESLGNPAQHYAIGGAIENQYKGRTPEDIWNNLSSQQRGHFLYDHVSEIEEYKNIERLPTSEIRKAYNSDWLSLDKDIKNRFANHTREGQYKAGGMLDANERYVLEIKGLTGLRKEAIENYIAENNLSDNDVLNIVIGLGRKQLKGSDVASAVVGKKGNALSKKVIEFAKDNKGMKLEEGGNIDAFTLRMVKGTAGKPDEAMAEPRSVQFAEGGGVSQKEKRQDYLENLLMLESEVWDKIGANSGGQIRQDEKLLRKYAEGVGSAMEKEGVGYGSFDEEDYEYFQDGNSHLLNEFLVWNNYYEPTMTKKEKAWRLKMYNEDVREKKKYSYVSNPEVITLNSTKLRSESDKKYIVNADIESVTVKKAGKEVTYSGKDVLNGANILKDGGGIEDKASYFSKNNVVSVKLKDGKTIKPANGYWVEKDATPIKNKEDMSSESKMMSFEEFSKKLPDVYDVYYGEKGVVYKAKYNRWADRMSYYKNGRRTDKNVVSLKGAYDTYKLDFENKNDKKMAYGGGMDTFSEYSNDALYDMMINLSRYENTESEIKMIKDELEKRKVGNLTIEEEIVYEKKSKKMETGGKTEQGVDLFEDYENIPPKLQAILEKYEDAFEDGDYRGLQKALEEANKIGYTFEYYLDGQAYDLRKIGEKGKSEVEEYATGGGVENKDTWQNIFEQYGFKKGQSKYGLDMYYKRGYNASVDKELRNVDFMFEDDVIYSGYSVQGLLASLKDEFSSRYGTKGNKMETGGKFERLSDKVAKNYEGKRVKPQYQKEYGKVYSKEEAKEVGDKVAGKVKANQKMATGGEAKKGGKGGIMILAKQIRKDGESWQDALKRASKQLK